MVVIYIEDKVLTIDHGQLYGSNVKYLTFNSMHIVWWSCKSISSVRQLCNV